MNEKKPIRYLSLSEASAHLGLAPGTLNFYRHKKMLPPPDAIIGRTQGWLVETIDEWNANRPGRGHRTDLEDWKNK